MTTKALTVQQEKALSLRDYLGQDSIKKMFQDALPAWMSVDRLYRVVFTSIMKNPKLIECTRESILSSVMQCAQLGLEPILGRAYLVPYNNTKFIDAKRVRVLECQFQPGYQGLIDLARRTSVISDCWGANVYEADEFDFALGLDRKLIHVPWYMDKSKAGLTDPGNIIGAYFVWKLKDGTRHPEFMPISAIHKRRDKSPAYNWAETGDPKKGGGKKDSIWHEWPEEQNLKTVVKYSSKFVPSSIEFMKAVELDNTAEAGLEQSGMFSDDFVFTGQFGPKPETEPEPESEPLDTSQFDHLANNKIEGYLARLKAGEADFPADVPLNEFLKQTAEARVESVDQLKVLAGDDFDSFWRAFEKWKEANYPGKDEPPAGSGETPGKDDKQKKKIPCPYSYCKAKLESETGVKTHITRSHDGIWPENKTESKEEIEAQAEAEAKEKGEKILAINRFRPEIITESLKRCKMIESPVLATNPIEKIRELFDMVHVVNQEFGNPATKNEDIQY